MLKKTLITAAISLFVSFSAHADYKTPNLCPEHYPLGAPQVVHHDKDRVLARSFYTCESGYATQHDPATKNAIWVSERITKERVESPREKRTDDFKPHPNLPKQIQSSLSDYRGSGFDRGHLAPAANMYGINETAMSESFYLTNMVPQVGPNNNRGIWADIEHSARQLAKKKGEILIVSGPIYASTPQKLNNSDVWIPTHLYKIILDPKTMDAYTYIVPNVQIVTRKTKNLHQGNKKYPQTLPEQAINCNSVCNMNDFRTPVSEIERLTGLHFFPKVQRN